MQLIDGKATAAQIKAEIAEEVKQIVESGGKRPHLAAILVGHDGGSETYVRNKVLACEACGFKSTLLRFEDTISEEELLAEVDKLNKDEDVESLQALGKSSQNTSNDMDDDENAIAEDYELPGADLSNEDASVTVIPMQGDEFICSECFLVKHRSQLAYTTDDGQPVCQECAA